VPIVFKEKIVDIRELNDSFCNDYAKDFENLCEKAKGYFWGWLLSGENSISCLPDAIMNFQILDCRISPIEQIFNICYYRYAVENIPNADDIEEFCGLPLYCCFIEELQKQKNIVANGKNYIVDFCIDFSRKNKAGQYIYAKFKNLKYVIELDGYDYHSNKKQMNYDYEREQNLQILGYKIMRFTGSQIYNKPYECIDKLIKMILTDMRKEIENAKTND
jgi:very-short-patch-repair endonuclease